MQIKIATRHGELTTAQRERLEEKAEKLTKFGRLMSIEVATTQEKGNWKVEFQVCAEHKNDFVASETGSTLEEATDLSLRKIESQLKRYKEKIQNHKGDIPQSGLHARPLGQAPGEAE